MSHIVLWGQAWWNREHNMCRGDRHFCFNLYKKLYCSHVFFFKFENSLWNHVKISVNIFHAYFHHTFNQEHWLVNNTSSQTMQNIRLAFQTNVLWNRIQYPCSSVGNTQSFQHKLFFAGKWHHSYQKATIAIWFCTWVLKTNRLFQSSEIKKRVMYENGCKAFMWRRVATDEQWYHRALTLTYWTLGSSLGHQTPTAGWRKSLLATLSFQSFKEPRMQLPGLC